jgi:hypothetical protein
MTAKTRHPRTAPALSVTDLRSVHEALNLLTGCKWLQAPLAQEALDTINEEWLARVELIMTLKQITQWADRCCDFTCGKPSACDVRYHALAVLEGPSFPLRGVRP